MSCVIDLASRRPGPSASMPLSHPAGVTLPFDKPCHADLIVPEVRRAICEGTYSAAMIRLLPEAVRPGDRVLVIGAGLGIVSTLIAKARGIDRVLAVEANIALIPYLERVHELNGVPWIEILNAVPTTGKRGRVPFFVRRDLRVSSTLPEEPWQQAIMVPQIDLNLILTEERISLIVWETPLISAGTLTEIDDGAVDRIAISGDSTLQYLRGEAEIIVRLARQGFHVENAGQAILLERELALDHLLTLNAQSTQRTGT